MNKLVSVIIPMVDYNDLFEKAITSVAKQTVNVFEVIVTVDRFNSESDISYADKVDNVSSLLSKSYENIKYKVITVECNVGPGVARRIAQTNASDNTSWFAFLDSDDFWLNDHLKNFFIWYDNNKINKNILYFDSYNSVRMPYHKLYFLNFLISPRLHTPSAIMSKTNLLFNVGRHSEDISYWIELYTNGFDVYCNNAPGSCGRTDRFITGQSKKIASMAFRKISFLFKNYFLKYPFQTLLGVCYELIIMPTRYFRKS